MGAIAVAEVAAGTNTAAVADADAFLVSGSYASTDKVTLTVGSFTKDITVGTINSCLTDSARLRK